jgi:hypothetical protein
MDRISLRQNQILATMWKLATKYGPERAAKLGSLD